MPPQETVGSKKNIVWYVVVAVIILGAIGYFWYQNTQMPSEESVLGEEANITVSLPKPGDKVGLPVIVEGQARVFENVVNFRLRDEKGKILAEGYTTANAPDIGLFGPFHGELTYSADKDGKGVVEVFNYSAKDGSEIDTVTIPVTYTKTPEFIKG